MSQVFASELHGYGHNPTVHICGLHETSNTLSSVGYAFPYEHSRRKYFASIAGDLPLISLLILLKQLHTLIQRNAEK
jgi:hypothetical protein